MGTTASSCIQTRCFQSSLSFFLPPPQYPTPSPVQDYNPDIGQTNVGGYGVNKDPYCHKVEKVIFENKCDTTYDIDTTTKDDYQCCNVETPNCYMEKKNHQRCHLHQHSRVQLQEGEDSKERRIRTKGGRVHEDP